MKKITLATAALLVLLAGCYNDKYDKLYPAIPINPATCDTTTITYSHDIQPIIVANCYNPAAGTCHNAVGSSGYNYEVFSVLQSNALSGWLLTDITFNPTRGHNSMPKGGTKLSDCDINKITRWVNQGALQN